MYRRRGSLLARLVLDTFPVTRHTLGGNVDSHLTLRQIVAYFHLAHF